MSHQTDNIVKYAFIVRQNSQFNCAGTVSVDSLYKIDGTKTNEEVARVISQMQMRIRFNTDCFKSVVLVSGENLEFTFETLDEYLNSMEPNELNEFLKVGSL